MKAFVYDKKDSKKIKEVKDVIAVTTSKEDNVICFVDGKNRLYQYDTREVKSVIYQN